MTFWSDTGKDPSEGGKKKQNASTLQWEVPQESDSTTQYEYLDGFYGGDQQYYIRFGELASNDTLVTASKLTGGALSYRIGGVGNEYSSGLRDYDNGTSYVQLYITTAGSLIKALFASYEIYHGWVNYTKP
jgi:hypothetical protein